MCSCSETLKVTGIDDKETDKNGGVTLKVTLSVQEQADFCPAVGEKFDQFQIQKLLGCGYFGKCFTVTKEDEPDKIMVLKVSDSFPNKQYFETELEVLRSLPVTHHFPNFISTFTIEDRLDCIVMTYQGICLKTMLEQNENKKFTLENTLRIGMQLMECVEMLHVCGWFHRDIHIENVTVNTDSGGNLKLALIDFGISISTNTPIDDRCLCKYPLIEDYVSVVEVLKLCSIIQEAETGAKVRFFFQLVLT
ncbi:unnamed protein product [Caenorhabditis brenneri]